MKALTSSLPKQFWRYERTGKSYQYLHYPSERARRLFYYARDLGEAWPKPGFRHSHRDEAGFILHFVLAGQFHHRVGGKTYVAQANDCCLFDLAEPVEYSVETPPPVHVLWLHFDGVLMPHVARELGADLDPVFAISNPARMKSLFRELVRLTRRQPVNYEAQASAVLAGLLAELFASRSDRLALPDLGIDPTKLSEPTRIALAMISRFHMQRKSVKELASEIGLSRYHFARLFHRETGFSPSQYLSTYRLETARTLLTTTDKPIQQIARSVGLPNVEHFSKIFRQRFSLSPRAYRQKMKPSLKPM